MNAVDLSWDQRRELLGHVREQLGAAQYDALRAQVGEEAILKRVLQVAAAAASASPPARRAALGWLWPLIMIACLVAGFAGMSYAGGGPLGVLCGVVAGGVAGLGGASVRAKTSRELCSAAWVVSSVAGSRAPRAGLPKHGGGS